MTQFKVGDLVTFITSYSQDSEDCEYDGLHRIDRILKHTIVLDDGSKWSRRTLLKRGGRQRLIPWTDDIKESVAKWNAWKELYQKASDIRRYMLYKGKAFDNLSKEEIYECSRIASVLIEHLTP